MFTCSGNPDSIVTHASWCSPPVYLPRALPLREKKCLTHFRVTRINLDLTRALVSACMLKIIMSVINLRSLNQICRIFKRSTKVKYAQEVVISVLPLV